MEDEIWLASCSATNFESSVISIPEVIDDCVDDCCNSWAILSIWDWSMGRGGEFGWGWGWGCGCC